MKHGVLAVLMAVSGACQAYDGWSSELSHAAGGALLAGAVAKLYSDSPHRAWIGFGVSTAAIVATESVSIARGGKRSSQYLDMASHAIGAAIGAWYTDKHLLMPMVSKDSVGVVFQTRF